MLPTGWQGHSERERRLAPLTTWRIGGPAEVFVEPETAEELSSLVRFFWRTGTEYRVLGGGSNLLVSDGGVKGAVLSLARMRGVRLQGDLLRAAAGAFLHAVIAHAIHAGRGGLENLTGIPGCVGGAIFGNAGSRYGAIGDVVEVLDVMEEDGTLVSVRPGPGYFGYRRSRVGSRIVVAAYLRTTPGDPVLLRARRSELAAERRRTQPGWIGNAGCVFRNPGGDSAGRLIDTAGCKLFREGGIRVAKRHANFFENVSAGTADQVQRLVERVQDRVLDVHDVELQMEVRRWS